MPKLLLKSLGMALAGLVVTPIVVFFVVLTLAHMFDSSCGTPGDSGGCEMGALGIAVAAALPGAALFFGVTLVRGLIKRRASSPA